jgi:thiol-disulfide isomerase/thioredoxin
MSEGVKNQQFWIGIFGGIAVISVIGLIIMSVAFMTRGDNSSGNVPSGNGDGVAAPAGSGDNPAPVVAAQAQVAGASTYSEKAEAEICTEDGKPVVYLFSTTWCPHCKWIRETFNSTVKEAVDAGKIKAYHWAVDIGDDELTDEEEETVPPSHLAVYREFNPRGSIPTFVFGCKYFRIGNGYETQNDLESEKAEFEALIEDLIK